MVASSHHVYKREPQELDVNTTRIIQVVAPGDVNFNLSPQNSGSDNETVVETKMPDINDSETICMSLPGFVAGLVMLLLVIIVASLVAAFLFVRVRAIDRKNAGFTISFAHPAYLPENHPEFVKVAN